MLRDSIDMVIRWRSDFGNTKDPSGITCRISLTISSRKNGCPCKRNFNDRSSTQGGGGARHDIMLPGHVEINVTTLGDVSQPSYLTEIQIRLVSGYLRLRIHEKKRCNTNCRDDIVRFSRIELWKWVPKSSSLNQGEGEGVADGLSDNSSRFPKRGISTLMWTRR